MNLHLCLTSKLHHAAVDVGLLDIQEEAAQVNNYSFNLLDSLI